MTDREEQSGSNESVPHLTHQPLARSDSRESVMMQNAPPPSYDSIFGKIKATKNESSNNGEFIKNLYIILVGTIGCTICMGFMLAIPICSIVIGSMYLGQCSKQPMIPIYLIVMGVAYVVQFLFRCVTKQCSKSSEDGSAPASEPMGLRCIGFIFQTFNSVWFIAGCYWIYKIAMPTAEECEATLYLYAFWVTTAVFIIIGLLVCFFFLAIICACCCACCCASQSNTDAEASA